MGKRFICGADRRGYTKKQLLMSRLTELGIETEDVGVTGEEDRTDYNYIAFRVARRVAEERAAGLDTWGLLICMSGAGMSIAANRRRGIRAVNCLLVEQTALARAHNDANVLCLSAMFTSDVTDLEILDTFLHTPFEGGRHIPRIQALDDPAQKES